MKTGIESNIDNVARQVMNLAQNMAPKKSKSFMQKEGNKFRKKVRDALKTNFKKRTGNLISSKKLKRGKVYYYKPGEAYQTRIHFASHTHLLEYGFRNIKAGKYVRGKKVIKKTEAAFASEFEKDVNDLINQIIKGV